MRSRSAVAPSALQQRWLYLTFVILWVTGVLWLYLQYVAPVDPTVGAGSHPSQPLWMKIHGAAAMGFLMVLGGLLLRHVPLGWRQKTQRPSGAPLLFFCLFLVLTGWGLYYAGSDKIRHWISVGHSVVGLSLPLWIAAHVWHARWIQRQRRPDHS